MEIKEKAWLDGMEGGVEPGFGDRLLRVGFTVRVAGVCKFIFAKAMPILCAF